MIGCRISRTFNDATIEAFVAYLCGGGHVNILRGFDLLRILHAGVLVLGKSLMFVMVRRLDAGIGCEGAMG